LFAALNFHGLTVEMNKRLILSEILKVSLIILLQCLRDDVLYVGMCVSPKPMKSIPERVCHASIVRLT
jgi:hypothetical protein